MDRAAWGRVSVVILAIFAALAAWIMLSLDSRSCEQLIRDVGQARLPDRCWR